MGDEAAEWEYMVTTLYANAAEQEDFLEHTWPGVTFPRFAPEALVPDLNAMGADGWELVSIEPVIYGVNGDVLISNSSAGVLPLESSSWTNAYQCFFKRRKSAS
jgi:hypothetical protein